MAPLMDVYTISLKNRLVLACEDYIRHKHHEDGRWNGCRFLIVLSEKKPGADIKRHLPKTIIHLDKEHFTEWYRSAAKEYALDKEKERSATRAHRMALWKLRLLATEVRRRFGVPYDENDGEAMGVFDDLAFDFVVQWVASKGEDDFELSEVTAEDIDRFCNSVAERKAR
jgi:hypothetical protein